MTKNIKLAMHTADLSDEKFLALQDLFPEAVTETITTDENGERVVTRAIDADVLQQLINKKVVSGKEERYQFTWPDKKKAMLLANAPINKTLRPCREESVDFDNTENLYIEGDNLDVLKLLRMTYFEKIKMIYIDPPYNTGNDFVYKDDYTEATNDFLKRDNQIDEEGNRLVANTENNGRYHTNWLNMMYPRLRLARDFLTQDGVVLISIDDNELENLKSICNEIFGEANSIATIVRNTNSSKNQSLFVSISHEYCLVYAKNIEILKEKHSERKWSVPKNNVEEYVKKVNQLQKEGLSNEEITKELKTLTKYPRFIDFTNYWYFDERGLYRKDNLGGVKNGNMTPLKNPLTGLDDPVPPGGYRYGKDKLEMMMKDNRIHFHSDGSLPTIKRYLHENEEQRPKSIMSDDQRPDYSLLKEFETPFDNPKQMSFMTRILSLADKDSIILDFFSGSSTTAHATMQLNAQDNGNRKFIMIQLPEKTDEYSEAFKLGFKNICEIGKERIKKAGNKIKNDMGLTAQNLDTGFRVLKLDESNMNNVYYSPEEYKDYKFKFEELIENVKADRTHEDILFQVMLVLGVPLSAKINVDGNIITVDDNYLVACFDKVDSETVTRIAKMQPYYAVFRDSSFINDSSLINVDQIFNTYSPTTKRRVI